MFRAEKDSRRLATKQGKGAAIRRCVKQWNSLLAKNCIGMERLIRNYKLMHLPTSFNFTAFDHQRTKDRVKTGMCKIILSPCQRQVEARLLLFLQGKKKMKWLFLTRWTFVIFQSFQQQKNSPFTIGEKATRTFVHIKSGLRTLPGVPSPTCQASASNL